jgi:hypothetical protein
MWVKTLFRETRKPRFSAVTFFTANMNHCVLCALWYIEPSTGTASAASSSQESFAYDTSQYDIFASSSTNVGTGIYAITFLNQFLDSMLLKCWYFIKTVDKEYGRLSNKGFVCFTTVLRSF